MTYEEYWLEAVSNYMTQPPHPIWFSKIVNVGIAPGYNNFNVIRKLDFSKNSKTLTLLL
jgi:hypothetical protein